MAVKEPLEDIRIIGLEDLLWLWRRQKKKLIRLAFCGAFLAFAFLMYRGALYRIEASFKEQKEESSLESKDLVKQLFSSSFAPTSAQVETLMESRAILRPLVQELGLQVSLAPNFCVKRLFSALKDLLFAELRLSLKDPDGFQFESVFYEGEKRLHLALQFQDERQFDLFQGRQKIGSGILGERLFCSNGLAFCIKKAPKTLKLHKKYRLRIDPWLGVVQKLSKKLKIAPKKVGSSFYDLTYLTRDRELGIRLINALMSQFQAHLKKEHDALAQEQIAFLARRQEELSLQLEKDLSERAFCMGKTLKEKGFLNASQELGIFSEPHAKMASELFAITAQLEQLEAGGALTVDSPLARSLAEKQAKLKSWQQQKDLLEVALSESPLTLIKSSDLPAELKEIQKKKQEVEALLQSWQAGQEVFSDPELLVSSWAQKLRTQNAPEHKQAIQEYLAGRIRLLSMREQIVSERHLQEQKIPSEFEGIDWETSRALYHDYTHRLDLAEVLIRSLQDVLVKLSSEDAELGCLSAILKDPVSQQLIASAGALYLQLNEKKYCSAKEELRWQDDWQLQKNLLKEHVQQMLRVEQMGADLMREKLRALQQVGLDCIRQQISILKRHIQEEIANRRLELTAEKQRLQEKMQEMRLEFAALPETWRAEQLFEFKSKTHQKMMEAIAHFAQTKIIGHHLYEVGSKPLDEAVSSLIPEPPYALLFLCLGSLCLSGVYFFIASLRQAFLGFPMTAKKFKALGLPFSGEISCSFPKANLKDLCPEDIEVLRDVSLFLGAPTANKVVGLLGRGGMLAKALAELSQRAGKNVCLVDLHFSGSQPEELSPGVLQFLEGSIAAPAFQKTFSFPYLPTGGSSPFGAEWIRSSRFSSLLSELKNRYDLIFLSFESPLAAAESKAALTICDQIVANCRGEQIDLLTPFIFWAYDKEYCSLTFVASKVS